MITPRATPARLVRLLTAREFRVCYRSMAGHNRHPVWVWPRQAAYYVTWRLTGWPKARVARAFDRDAKTVLHGIRQVERRMHDNASYAVRIAAILRAATAALHPQETVSGDDFLTCVNRT